MIRYFDWLADGLQGDFGISYVNPKRTVAGEILRCLPATLQLAGASFVIVLLLSIPIGFLCAVYKDGWFDKMMRSIVFVTTAMPPYWVGLLLMVGNRCKIWMAAYQWKRNMEAFDPSCIYSGIKLYIDLYPADTQ